MVAVANFRSVGDMARRIALGLCRIPQSVNLVVAVGESGTLAASFLGLQIDRPVVDLEWFLQTHGKSLEKGSGHVLLVDDIARTGTTMRRAREQIAFCSPCLNLTTLAVYCQRGAEDEVDIALERAEAELLLEWSLFRSPVMAQACLDMDGILCADARSDQDDDGPAYRDFLVSTARHAVPRGRVHRIVTSRLEKYRSETEAWLTRQGIAYDALTMLDLPSEAERRRLMPQARFKAEVYRADDDALLFIESETWQARAIARAVSGKAVFDYRTRTLLDGASLARTGIVRQVKGRVQSRLNWEVNRIIQRFRLKG